MQLTSSGKGVFMHFLLQSGKSVIEDKETTMPLLRNRGSLIPVHDQSSFV